MIEHENRNYFICEKKQNGIEHSQYMNVIKIAF